MREPPHPDAGGRQQVEGIDIADHGAWDGLLGSDAVACDVRMQGRPML